ncbi:MAG: PQQ-binding-like beta-propeller repeat protein [Planctomycetes bacterium]|nr:PQQ-binding-like beta-propeller repeat protein [Planctomycetota bacterium]
MVIAVVIASPDSDRDEAIPFIAFFTLTAYCDYIIILKMLRTLKITLTALLCMAAINDFCSGQAAGTVRSIAFVNTDANADSLFKQSQQALAKGDWPACVKCMQDLLEKYPDKSITVETNLYTGASFYCHNFLMGMPPEGVSAYRSIFDARAARLFDTAMFRKDVSELRKITALYPASTYALPSAMSAASLLVTNGNLTDARETLENLQNYAIDTRKEIEPARIAQLGLIYNKLKDKPALQALIDYTIKNCPDIYATVADGSENLRNYLENLLNRTPNPPAPVAQNEPDKITWPAFCGNNLRNAQMADFSQLPQKKWSIPLPSSTYAPIRFKPSASGGFFYQGDPRYTPFFPILMDGKVFIHNGAALYAYDIFSSKDNPLLWQHIENNPNLILFDEKVIYSGAIYNNKLLYVNLVGSIWREDLQLGWLHVKMPFPCRSLMAFDINTGKIAWRIGGDVSKTEFLAHSSFPIPPAVEGNCLYVPAVYAALATDPPEQYLFCLDAETGQLKWKTFIASGFLEINLFNSPAREQVASPVTVWEDLLLFCSNSGAIAGINKYTGEVIWKRTYDQYKILPTRDDSIEKTPTGWMNNPILIDNGTAYFAPADSPNLLAVNARTGKLAWQWPGNIGIVNPSRHMLGIKNSKLVITNDVEQLSLSTLEKDKGRLTGRTMLSGGERIAGRGFIAGNNIYLPTSKGLYQIDIDDNKKQSVISWEKNSSQECGNMLAFENMAITTSLGFLNIYMSGQVLEDYLRKTAEKYQDDPAALYNYAQALSSSAKYDNAEIYLKKIIQITKDKPADEKENIRQKSISLLCEITIKKSGLLWNDGKKETVPGMLLAVRDIAGDQYNYTRLTLALCYYYENDGKYEPVIDEMQKLISKFPDGLYEAGNIRIIAREKIQRMISMAGDKAYEKYETQARTLFTEASRKKNVDILKKTVLLYPNSRAAEESAMFLAEEYMARDKLSEAAETLQYFRRDFPKSRFIPEAMLKLAALSEKNGLYATAERIYSGLLKDYSDAFVKIDSVDTNIGTIVKKKLAEKPYSEMPTPDFPEKRLGNRLGMKPSWSVPLRNTDSLRMSVTGAGYASKQWEKQVIFSDDQMILSVSTDNGTVLWKLNMPAPSINSGFANDKLILAYNDKLMAYDPKGARIWLFPANNITRQAIITDAATYILTFDGAEQNNMFITAVDNMTGTESWKTSLHCRTLLEMQFYNDLIFIPLGPLNKLAVYDAVFGTEYALISLPAEIRKIVPAGRNRLCVLTRTEEIYCFETGTGKLLWKIKAEGASETIIATDENSLACCLTSKTGGNFDNILLIDLTSGTIKQIDLPLNTKIKQFNVQNGVLYTVVSTASPNRFATNILQITAYNMKDGSLKWTYPQQIASDTANYSAKFNGNRILLVNVLFSRRDALVNVIAEVLNADTGASSNKQIIRLETRNVNIDLFNGDLYITADGTVSRYESQE